MKKKFLAAVLAAVMMFTVIGCGNGAGDGKVKLKAHSDEKTTVTVTLGEYKGMALKGATDAELQSTLDSLCNSLATEEEIDGPAESGDTVNINYAGYLDGVAFEGGTDDSEAGYDLTLGSGAFIAGFEDGLIGAKKGESRDLNLTFPETYSNNPDLAGKAVVFKVTVNAVKRTVIPELNDELAVTAGYASLEELKTDAKESLDKEAYQTTVSNTLLEICSVENIPSYEIDKAADEFYHSYYDYCEQMATAYGMDVAYILYYMTGYSSPEEFQAYSKVYADKQINYQYIIEAIFQNEKLDISEDEYMTRAMEYAKQYGYDNYEDFETDYTKEIIEGAIQMDYVMDYIIENAQKF